MEHNKSSFVRNAVILSIAGFVTRILGFVFRIILSNNIGAEGIGLFQLALPVYFIAASFLASGIPIAVSRLVAEQKAKGNYKALPKIVVAASVIAVVAGVTISVILFFYAKSIAIYVLRSPSVYYPMMVYIPALFITAGTGVIRGFFQGIQNIMPQAIGQIVEQVMRMIVILSFVEYAMSINVIYASTIAALGMVIGDVANLLVMMGFYKGSIRKFRNYSNENGSEHKTHLGLFSIGRTVITIALPISIGRVFTTLLGTVDEILIPQRLQVAGYSAAQSLEIFGQLAGMTMPLILFPSTITMALSMTLLPAIAEARSLGGKKMAIYRATEAVKLTMFISFAAMAVFLFLPYQIGYVLYHSMEVGRFLFYFAFSCMFIYVEGILASILNGLGKQNIAVFNAVFCSLMRISFTYILVAIPGIGINGYLIAFVGTVVLNTMMNYLGVRRFLNLHFDSLNWFAKPLLASIGMGLVSSVLYNLLGDLRIMPSANVVVSLLTGLAVYLFLTIRMGVITIDEIKRFVKL